MADYTLTVLDTPGIQRYTFGSNRLRENIGGSELVRRATEQWPLEILKMENANVLNPAAADPAQWLDDERCIEQDQLDAEVIYVGGGNTAILFREQTHARAFVTQLSHKMLEEAPGLALAAAHVPVDWEQDRLFDKVDQAMQRLARQKQARPASQPLLGLGVTAACQSTGLVAMTTSAAHDSPQGADAYPISDAVAAKLETVQAAQDRLKDILDDDIQRENYDFPRDFDEFGRSKGEMSYIAVIHADGNQIGSFFRSIGAGATDSRAYIRAMRSASIRVAQAGMNALAQTVCTLIASIDGYDTDNNPLIGGKVPVRDGKLPIRPLVFGGDDVTFVCDGRLGLTLAAHYLAAFEAECQKRRLDLHACAGIAVVKTHYPFARAYRLSEELTKSAKKYVREKVGPGASALDWHFATGGLMGGIKEIRRREYTVSTGALALRPLPLADLGWRSWPKFTMAIEDFEQEWQERRNKRIALREVLRQGPEATETYLCSIGQALPELDSGIPDLQRTGWLGAQCVYFDAIEAADFYVPLRGA